MKIAISLLGLLMALQADKSPTPQSAELLRRACGKDGCISFTTTANTTFSNLTMPEPDGIITAPVIKDGRKTYTLDFKEDWTCVMQSDYRYENPSSDRTARLVTVTCIKADPPTISKP